MLIPAMHSSCLPSSLPSFPQGWSVLTRSVLYQILLLSASSLVIAKSGSASSLAAHQLAMALWLLPSILLDSLGEGGRMRGKKGREGGRDTKVDDTVQGREG